MCCMSESRELYGSLSTTVRTLPGLRGRMFGRALPHKFGDVFLASVAALHRIGGHYALENVCFLPQA